MHSTFFSLLTLATLFFCHGVKAQTAYANDFVNPDYILAKDFGPHTYRAQSTIISWASRLASGGPWIVTSKPFTPPSGTKHDFMSWAPYWWPDCSGVGNTTALSPEQVWKTCPYKSRDGQFNPDTREVNDVGNFQDMSEAVFYNAMAWVVSNTTATKGVFEENAVKFIRAWFLDEATRMNPNLNFAQMQRGPDGQTGSRTGVLDLKGMAKIASALLLLRKGGSTAWTSDLDNKMIAWSREYITWLENSELATDERDSENNHGTFYYNQLAALKIIVNDLPGATTALNHYFNGQFKAQISANGEQPLESARTRPYHYRAYNLAAMITNARLLQYASSNSKPFQSTSNSGATIKTALDFAMTISSTSSGEREYTSELYPNIAAVAAVYGDTGNHYLNFLTRADSSFITEPYILWNQPFAVGVAAGFQPTGRTYGGSAQTMGGQTTGSSVTRVRPTGSMVPYSDAEGAAVSGRKVLLSLLYTPIALALGLMIL